MNKSDRKDERGLTLIELLAVVVILAIVAAIAFVLIANVIENAKKDAAVSNGLHLIGAAKLYEATHLKDEISTRALTLTDLRDAELIGDIHDPWTKEAFEETESNLVQIEKEGTTPDGGGRYRITIHFEGCDITQKTEDDLHQSGRVVCD